MWLNDLYHALNPIALSLGPLTVRWYGLAYLAGFVCCFLVVRSLVRRWELGISDDDLLEVVIAIAFGVILGARLGYVLFYGAGYYLENPLKILAFNEGGMSFHGGLVGAVVGGALACRHRGIPVLTMADMAACAAPLGLFFGRLANFVNGELWGKETDLPWGVMFDRTGGGAVYRHPSQLYEALLEGLVLFCVLWALSRRRPPRPQGTFIGTFALLYGCFRFLIEFVRLPDSQLGYLLGTGWLTMGQCLSLPLVVIGICILTWSHRASRPQEGQRTGAEADQEA